ncbi:unnamed protein product [Spirodela intermedia]|uniref:Uncharacterized protein n=1 Tax=Spirodela intermedia TaxID=51605 RepID=A0A7I8KQX6_SPIIN|nr:unnamed protein product [Spirodela intermedia]
MISNILKLMSGVLIWTLVVCKLYR